MRQCLIPTWLTRAAQCLFALAILYIAYIFVTYFQSDADGNPLVFFFLCGAILAFGLFIIAVISYFLSQHETFTNENYYRAIRCALWWTATGVLYFSMGLAIGGLLGIFGFLFLILAFFLWIEAVRQGYLGHRQSKRT